MALFNQIPVLDKGFVGYVSVGLPTKEMNKLSHHYFKANIPRELIDLGTVTLIMKFPMFVQLHLIQEYGLKVINAQPATSEPKIETYTPTVSDIGSGDTSLSQDIVEHMEQTANSLEVTVKGYQRDGCDHFVSQVNLPIGVYNEAIVHGSISQWVRFLKRKNLPKPVAAYQEAVFQIIKADFPNLNLLMNKVV